MDTLNAFKHSAELREYWRLEKRKQRAREKRTKVIDPTKNGCVKNKGRVGCFV